MNKILVLGTALIDNIIQSNTPINEGICNKASSLLMAGGSMRNVAYNLGILGLKVDFLSVWGNDDYSLLIKKELKAIDIDTKGPQIDLPTPVFTHINTAATSYSISSFTPDFYLDYNYPFAYQDYSLLITDSENEKLLENILTINPDIKFIITDHLPNIKFDNIIGIALNRHEFYNQVNNHNYHKVCKDYPNAWLTVTLDVDGAFCGDKADSFTITNKNIVANGCSLGCGDAFVSAMIYKMQKQASLKEATDFSLSLSQKVYNSPKNVLVKD